METVSISALNQFVFCPRRCALMHVEGIWSDNEHTAKGTILHSHTDERGYETVGGARLLRALPLFSAKYGLSGKADIVEIRGKEIIPVEYKKGKRRQFENDEIQLAAQALCLEEMLENSPRSFARCGLKFEEMFQTKIKRGFIYHAASKKRREVVIDENLRRSTIETVEKVRRLLSEKTVPAAEYKPRCEGCSLYNICLPKLSDEDYRKSLETEI